MIEAGFSATCGVTTSGAAKCWGSYTDGVLGSSSATANRTSPGAVSGLASGVVSVALVNGHACAATSENVGKCWGSNSYGQLGTGTASSKETTPKTVTVTAQQ